MTEKLHDPVERRAAGPQSNGGQPSGSGGDYDASTVAPRARPSTDEPTEEEPRTSSAFVRRVKHATTLHESRELLAVETTDRGRPFVNGNERSLVHGAYSKPAKLAPEVDALADELAPLVPAATEADGPAIQLLALCLVRIGRAEPLLRAAEESGEIARHERLDTRQRAWTGTALRLLDALGMTPTARARLAKDAAQGAASAATVEALLARGRELRLGRTADEPADASA